ncbi:MAG: TerC family protein [Armatimonadetes bacterium]|nr:TerC family protein [Armatimonadota bacterium]
MEAIVSIDSIVWIGFILFVLGMLALDLGVFHRKSHEVKLPEALVWSAVWIGLALTFNLGVYYWKGSEAGVQFLTAYVIEKALSVDNLFVFLMIFAYFQVPARYQHRVLFYGIVGALVMRAIFIAAGISLIERFHWMVYVFGAFLVFTGVKMLVSHGKEVHPERNPVLRLMRRFLPMSDTYKKDRLFVRRSGGWMATPLFAVLVLVESTDVVFAVDSIPAVLAVTSDPFIVYTSNVFAILGLRSLYFALAGVMGLFHYLHYGLSAVLCFVGVKMLVTPFLKVPPTTSLAVIAGILGIAVVLSLMRPPAAAPTKESDIIDSEIAPNAAAVASEPELPTVA